MDRIVNLNTARWRRRGQRAIWPFLQNIEILLHHGIEILFAIQTLYDCNYIDHVQFEYLLTRFSTNADVTEGNRMRDFVETLYRLCPRMIITITRELTQIAIKSRTNILSMTSNREVRSLRRFHELELIRFFSVLKGKMDTSHFTDMMCQHEADNCIRRAQAATDLGEKQRYYNQSVIARGLQVQKHRDSDMHTRRQIYEGIIGQIPDCADKTFAKLTVSSKTATTLANLRDFAECNTHLLDILQQINTSDNNLFKAIFGYDIIYALRCEDTHTHVSRVKDIVEVGSNALCALGKYHSPETKFLERLIMIHMVQALLGIGADLSIKPVGAVKATHKFAAKRTLEDLRTNYWPMEPRREMMYNMCQARLFEIEGRNHMALHYSNRALDLTSNGAYFNQDKENITSYRKQNYDKAKPISVHA